MSKLKYLLLAFIFISELCFAKVDIVPTPKVPELWTVSMEGNTVVYKSPMVGNESRSQSVLRFTYNRSTHTKDAKAIAEEYKNNNQCDSLTQQGKGFYTISCKDLSKDVIILGEINNLYTIEVLGHVSKEAVELLNGYVSRIVNGKRSFEDREIGEPLR